MGLAGWACRWLAVLTVVLLGMPVHAQTAMQGAVLPAPQAAPPSDYAACSGFVALHAQGRSDSAMTFISGYGTARYAATSRRAVAEADPLFGQTRAAAAQWLADWCADNPRRSLADAALHFYDQLAGAGPLAALGTLGTPVSAPQASAAAPSSCSAASVGICAGCSTTCPAPKLAVCSPGREGPRGPLTASRCGAPSYCECR